MFRNLLTVAFRGMVRHRGYSLLNVLGLAVSLACCLVITNIIVHNLSFDRHQSKYSDLYRFTHTSTRDGRDFYTEAFPMPAAKAFRLDYPEIDAFVNTNFLGRVTVTFQRGSLREKFREERVAIQVEPEYFNLFDFKWLEGDGRRVMDNVNSVVLAKSFADKYFPGQSALGQTLRMDDKVDLVVTGVYEDQPANSHFNYGIIMHLHHMQALTGKNPEQWGNLSDDFQVYIYETNPTELAHLRNTVVASLKKHNTDLDPKQQIVIGVQTLHDMHFDQRFGTNTGNQASTTQLWVLGSLGLVLLLIACINYINMATARVLQRSQEIAIRKVLGGSRGWLMLQVWTETALLTSFGLFFALVLAELMMPYINQTLAMSLAPLYTQFWWVLPLLLVLLLISSGLSALYPAILMGRVPALASMKTSMLGGRQKGVSVRKGMIVTQFVVTQALVAGVFIIHAQMSYMRNTDLGFQSDAVVVINLPSERLRSLQSLQSEINQQPGVLASSLCLTPPFSNMTWSTSFTMPGKQESEPFSICWKPADVNYGEVFGLQMAAGRWYTQQDSMNVVINETFARKMGYQNAADAVGKSYNTYVGTHQIVGVVKDFHTQGLKREIQPYMLIGRDEAIYNLAVKVNSSQFAQTIERMEKAWDKVYPQHVYSYTIMDDAIANTYKSEERMFSVVTGFAVIAILIAVLGLVGLAAYMTEQRSKEIGVRKVLGASVGSILRLLSREFALLVAIAFVIATPLAWYGLNNWLEGYTYRIAISPLWFIGSFLLSLFFAVSVVILQSWRAANRNPVQSLKTQ